MSEFREFLDSREGFSLSEFRNYEGESEMANWKLGRNYWGDEDNDGYQMFDPVSDAEVEYEDFDYADDYSDYLDSIAEDNLSDVEADANTLASAGYGTDEDYGDFGQYDDYDW